MPAHQALRHRCAARHFLRGEFVEAELGTDFWPIAGALMALPTFLVFRQPDLGTALVFVAILVGMLFMSGASLGWMGLLAAAVIGAAPVAVSMLQDYQRQRLFCFLDPSADPQGACFQLIQALNAVGAKPKLPCDATGTPVSS